MAIRSLNSLAAPGSFLSPVPSPEVYLTGNGTTNLTTDHMGKLIRCQPSGGNMTVILPTITADMVGKIVTIYVDRSGSAYYCLLDAGPSYIGISQVAFYLKRGDCFMLMATSLDSWTILNRGYIRTRLEANAIDQSNIASGAEHTLTFTNNELTDLYNRFSTSTFTAGATGLHRVSGSLGLTCTSAFLVVQVGLYRDGVFILWAYIGVPGYVGLNVINWERTVSLNYGQALTVRVLAITANGSVWGVEGYDASNKSMTALVVEELME